MLKQLPCPTEALFQVRIFQKTSLKISILSHPNGGVIKLLQNRLVSIFTIK